MTIRTFALTTALVAALPAAGAAQADQPPTPAAARQATPRAATPGPAQPTPAPTAAPAPEPRRNGQPVNIKVDVTITEQRGSTVGTTKKTATVVVADGQFGAIRTQSDVFAVANQMPLNIDAEPQLLMGPGNENKIRLRLNLQYDLPSPLETQGGSNPPRGTVLKTQLHDNLSLVLENGKPVVAAQSVDPVGDRRVTVEVTATVIR